MQENLIVFFVIDSGRMLVERQEQRERQECQERQERQERQEH